MVDVKVYSDIANQKDGIFLSMMGMSDAVFSADIVNSIFQQHPDEQEFRFNIHCDGGSVAEGLAIYDIIRNSGKTIYTNIEGSCHSMAITLLLAAPKERRTANPNCRALVHQVRAITDDQLNSTELRRLAQEVDREQNTILDIYAQRTGHSRAGLEALMKSERILTAKELLQYGFISKINQYTTNKISKQKNDKMSRNKKEVINSADLFLRKLKNLLNTSTVNFDFTDEEGNLLFSTEGEDDKLEVGMPATPDGEFELPDGTLVTIEKGVITQVVKAGEEAELEKRVEELENALKEANKVITNLKNQVRSTYNVKPRIATTRRKNSNQLTADEKKNEAKEKIKQAKK